MRGEIPGCRRRAAAGNIGRACHERKVTVDKLVTHMPGLHQMFRPECHIDARRDQIGFGIVQEKLHAQSRMNGQKLRDPIEAEYVEEISRCGHADHAASGNVAIAPGLSGEHQGGNGRLAAFEELAACGREAELAGGAVDQPAAELAFKLPDLAADGVRGHSQLVAGLREAAGAHDFHEQKRVIEVDQITCVFG